MPQSRDDLDLAQEPFSADGRARLGMENLYGDRSSVPDVLGEVDRRYSTAADLPVDRVLTGECLVQFRSCIGQIADGTRERQSYDFSGTAAPNSPICSGPP